MVIYTYSITELLKEPTTGEIKRIYFKGMANAEDGVAVMCDFSTPTEPANPDNFTPYEDLTEDMVIGWITDKDSVNVHLSNLLDEARLQKVSELPWAN